MLHSTAGTLAAYTGSITGALLIFVAGIVPVAAQSVLSSNFENRFFFSEGAAPLQPPESASPRTAPATSEVKPQSERAQPAPSSFPSLITSPAAAAPAPQPFRTTFPEPSRNTQAADLAAPTQAIPPRARPTGSGRAPPVASGRAAWYEHPGRTASGEIFDPNRLTAAHKTLPFGTRLRVVNLRNGRTVMVRVNDRIPAKTKHIAIDLSRASARAIGISGIGRVALYPLNGSL